MPDPFDNPWPWLLAFAAIAALLVGGAELVVWVMNEFWRQVP